VPIGKKPSATAHVTLVASMRTHRLICCASVKTVKREREKKKKKKKNLWEDVRYRHRFALRLHGEKALDKRHCADKRQHVRRGAPERERNKV
jgi:hypothetical protein